ncbi:expressed protein [Chlorella variabilis]|uniref:Expressed protein n=1 Tax=Chlorella variabilis TaxID=554065 RepID=E1Z9E0_CHLVA|nr:expressed protein [Chlorella variabilis]EFN57762.1 expressed protein [Chlorella variabilis]|eukprot:XP_005849864.1 expressed protein [Chlorella variabilis]
MNQPVILYALERRQNGAKNVFLTKSDVEGIIRIKQGDQQAPSGRRRRGVGGGAAVQGGAKNYSKKVLQFFQVLKGAGGQDILCRCVKRSGEWRWCPVVPLEELPRVIKEHHERATGSAVDLIDLGEGRDPKYRYIMSYVDLFTRHVSLKSGWTPRRQPGCSDNGKEFVAGIILELCQAFGVTAINGAIGKPQSQGCVERSNRTVKDKISAQLQMAPTIAWRYQVRRVQGMINHEPAAALGRKMTRSQALFGEPSQRVLQAPAEFIARLLGIASDEEMDMEQGVDDSPAVPTTRTAARRPTAWAPITGRKRSAVEAELADEAEVAAAAAAMDEGEAPARRSSQRAAAAGLIAVLAMEHELEDAEEVLPVRQLPQRTAATSSPAGQHRNRIAVLAAAAAAAASEAGEEQAAAEAEEEAAAEAEEEQAATEAEEEEAATEAEEEEAVAEAEEEQAAAEAEEEQAATEAEEEEAATEAEEEEAAAEAEEEQAAAEAEEEQAAAEAEEEQAAAEAEEGGTLAAPHPPMPAHLQATRSRVAAAQVKNRQRIAAQRRPKGEPKDFAVGDDVLLLPPKRGKVGKQLGRNRIVCRVVEIKRPFGVTMYRLRSGAGVVEGMHQASRLSKAPPSLASELTFSGTAQRGVPVVSLNVAMAAQPSGGKAALQEEWCAVWAALWLYNR